MDNDTSMIQHNNIFIILKSEKNERRLDYTTRKWFILKNIHYYDNITKLLNLSKIYVSMKNIGCEYNEEITLEISECQKRLYI